MPDSPSDKNGKKHLFYINKRRFSLSPIRMKQPLRTLKRPIQPTSPTPIVTDHLLGFRGLVLVMPRLGLFIVFLGTGGLLLHHPIRLAHGARGPVGAGKNGQQGQ